MVSDQFEARYRELEKALGGPEQVARILAGELVVSKADAKYLGDILKRVGPEEKRNGTGRKRKIREHRVLQPSSIDDILAALGGEERIRISKFQASAFLNSHKPEAVRNPGVTSYLFIVEGRENAVSVLLARWMGRIKSYGFGDYYWEGGRWDKAYFPLTMRGGIMRDTVVVSRH